MSVTKRFMAVLFGVIFMSGVFAGLAMADVKLPAPKTEGGIGIFAALKARSSSPGDVLTKPLNQEELATILWAATGLNRPDKGWTVPMAMGKAPYCRVYVASAEGAFIYDWAAHSLKEITKADIRGNIGAQSFVKNVGQVLIIVADGGALSDYDKALATELAGVATGAITQNIYLAAAGLDVGARYVMSIKSDQIKTDLKLAATDYPICIMLLGKK